MAAVGPVHNGGRRGGGFGVNVQHVLTERGPLQVVAELVPEEAEQLRQVMVDDGLRPQGKVAPAEEDAPDAEPGGVEPGGVEVGDGRDGGYLVAGSRIGHSAQPVGWGGRRRSGCEHGGAVTVILLVHYTAASWVLRTSARPVPAP